MENPIPQWIPKWFVQGLAVLSFGAVGYLVVKIVGALAEFLLLNIANVFMVGVVGLLVYFFGRRLATVKDWRELFIKQPKPDTKSETTSKT